MKKLAMLLVAMLLAGLGVTSVFAASGGPSLSPAGRSNTGQLTLFEKDASWNVVEQGAFAKMRYDLAAPTFNFVFNGHKLDPGDNYTLIYFSDPWGQATNICIASGEADAVGDVHLKGSVELNTDLPVATDTNAPGAKMWLVLSSDVNCAAGTMAGWNPTEWLFEDVLITYDDTDVP